MRRTGYGFEPDYNVAPGWVIEEMLEARGMNQAELARRCDRSPKLISQIIHGKAPIEPATAIRLQRVFGVNATLWLNMDSIYQLRNTREKEREQLTRNAEWAREFPLDELVSAGEVPRPESKEDAVGKLLEFFGVGSIAAWERQFGTRAVSYRHSPTFKSDRKAVLAWLRIGELRADGITCAAYDESVFRRVLREIRKLTLEPASVFETQMRELCWKAGVVLALVPPLPKTRLSGAARWLNPRTALIQMTLRHKTDDHFWFTFFHEAGHILYSRKRIVFVDGEGTDFEEAEKKADAFARDTLVPPAKWGLFVERGVFTRRAIEEFAEEEKVAPGIIVGRLQHEEKIPYDRHNSLKRRLE